MAVGDCIKNCLSAGCPDKKILKLVIPNFDLPAISAFLAAVLTRRKTKEKQNSLENAYAWRPGEILVHWEWKTILIIKKKGRDFGA